MTGTSFPERATSRAVLIGTGAFHDPELPDIPAVRANLDGLRRTLTHPVHGAFEPEHCVVVADPKDQATVGAALSQAVRESEDLLLVYYCGHGLLDEDGLLHFALTGTDTENVSFSAIHLDLVKRMVGGARAKARVLVLDCCFSGQAVSSMAGRRGLALGQLNLTGTYTLTSTTATAPAHAPPGAAHTAFTGSMLRALAVPGPLTLDEVHRHVDKELAGLGLPRPQRRSVGAVGELSLVRGPIRESEASSTAGAQAPTEADTDSTTRPASPRRIWAWRTVPAIVVLSAVALLGNLLRGDSEADSSLFSGDKVLVGLESDTDNSMWLSPRWGSFSAFSLDTVGELLKEANVKSRPIRVDVKSSDQIDFLQNRTVDLNAALAMTSKRTQEVEFVGPIASDRLGLLDQKSANRIQRIVDLDGKIVCVPADSNAEEAMRSGTFKTTRVVKKPGSRSCIEALEEKVVDAVAGDSLSLSAAELENNQLKVVPGVRFSAPSYYGVALPKGYSKDCKRLRDVLMKYVSSGMWLKAFQTRLPNVSQRGDELRPSTTKIQELSCRRLV
ncbi:caspase, EACC1-associated type [Streptomyces noursei]|uniref:caspase, EACC1-associated type n=1 Tax=Streptomyces noursei TaxID=1971 RepID=UPI00099C059B|nr:transporter substrate-binding domain-containing protein [Streptomyces noursei]